MSSTTKGGKPAGRGSELVAAWKTREPKTVLGFLQWTLVSVLGAASAIVASLVSGGLTQVVPYVLAFVGLAVVLVVGGVLYFAAKDPTKLQLGQVSGEAYLEHLRITQGDSSSGETVDHLGSATTTVDVTPVSSALPAPREDDQG